MQPFTIAINLGLSPFTQILRFSYCFFNLLIDFASIIRFKHLNPENEFFLVNPISWSIFTKSPRLASAELFNAA